MENMSFVKNGVLRLPPGFRFHPTDEELVVQYLKNKVFSFPLPASVIPELDLSKFDPWDLPGDELERERYFFSTREAKYVHSKRCNRATGSGYWKATGIDKKIVTSKENQLVGFKKTLVFYRGKPLNGIRTDWIMHEYRLRASNGYQSIQSCVQLGMENWVLCRIFSKKRSTREREKKKKMSKPVFHEFLRKKETDLNIAPASSSSGSSGVTEISTNHEEEEEISSFPSFPFFRR